MKIHESLKYQVKMAARRKGIKLKDLAAEIEMHPTDFSQRLAGTKNLSLKDLERIAEALEVQPYELLKPE